MYFIGDRQSTDEIEQLIRKRTQPPDEVSLSMTDEPAENGIDVPSSTSIFPDEEIMAHVATTQEAGS